MEKSFEDRRTFRFQILSPLLHPCPHSLLQSSTLPAGLKAEMAWCNHFSQIYFGHHWGVSRSKPKELIVQDMYHPQGCPSYAASWLLWVSSAPFLLRTCTVECHLSYSQHFSSAILDASCHLCGFCYSIWWSGHYHFFFFIILLLDTLLFPSGGSYSGGISSLAHVTWFTHAGLFEDL